MKEYTIDITKIPVMWTTCDKSQDRHAPMEKMLQSLGISGNKVNGPITDPYTIGVAVGYKEALLKYKAPFLVLEDDATLVSDTPNKIFEVGENFDALYLGSSIHGRLQNKTVAEGVIAADAGKYLRVFNMLSFHAILYLTENYVTHVLNILEEFITNPIGGTDDPVAETMWAHNVYTVKTPVFYQKDGRSDAGTKRPIRVLLP